MDLNTLIPPDSGWVLLIAYGINNSGGIVGVGIVTNNGSLEAHACALMPVNQNPPPVRFSVSGNQLTLGWLINSGWILQVQTNGSGVGVTPTNNWCDVPGSDTQTNMVITINPTNPAVLRQNVRGIL